MYGICQLKNIVFSELMFSKFTAGWYCLSSMSSKYFFFILFVNVIVWQIQNNTCLWECLYCSIYCGRRRYQKKAPNGQKKNCTQLQSGRKTESPKTANNLKRAPNKMLCDSKEDCQSWCQIRICRRRFSGEGGRIQCNRWQCPFKLWHSNFGHSLNRLHSNFGTMVAEFESALARHSLL